ncbi:MAG: hypothetical protein AAF962_15220 [Actinomycetota bacterium]
MADESDDPTTPSDDDGTVELATSRRSSGTDDDPDGMDRLFDDALGLEAGGDDGGSGGGVLGGGGGGDGGDDAELGGWQPIEEPASKRSIAGSTLPKRGLGLLALVLGAIGVAASIVIGVLVVWAGIRASSTVERLTEPLLENVDRIDARIDQADDAVDRDGIAADRMPELVARAEGLTDVTTAAQELAENLEEHPVYGWLPADLDPLLDIVDDFAGRAATVQELVESNEDDRPLPASVATEVTEEINSLQDEVDQVGDTIEGAADSLRRWIRIGSVIGLLLSIWSGWAQYCLARRGLRGLRGHTA